MGKARTTPCHTAIPGLLRSRRSDTETRRVEHIGDRSWPVKSSAVSPHGDMDSLQGYDPLFCNERVVTRETEKKKGRIIYWTALMVMG